MRIFIRAYGAEAGVAALKWLPYGGLFLAGGLTPKNIDAIKYKNGPFMEAFMDKGRVAGMLAGIPVYAVMAEDIGERGAHLVAYKDLQAIVNKRKLEGKGKAAVQKRTSNSNALLTATIATSVLFTIGWTVKGKY